MMIIIRQPRQQRAKADPREYKRETCARPRLYNMNCVYTRLNIIITEQLSVGHFSLKVTFYLLKKCFFFKFFCKNHC